MPPSTRQVLWIVESIPKIASFGQEVLTLKLALRLRRQLGSRIRRVEDTLPKDLAGVTKGEFLNVFEVSVGCFLQGPCYTSQKRQPLELPMTRWPWEAKR